MKLLIQLLLFATLTATAGERTMLTVSVECGQGKTAACKVLRTHCEDGEDYACSRLALHLFYDWYDYSNAKFYADKGCAQGGKDSCELSKSFKEELNSACKKHWLGACKALENL